MEPKLFYLIGKEDIPSLQLELSQSEEIDHVKDDVGTYFGIARPESISFHSSNDSLDTIDKLLRCTEKVGIRVDGCRIRQPMCPAELPFFGNHFQIHPDHMGNHDRLHQKYGSVVKTVNLGTTTYLTDDPDVSEVLLRESEYFTKTVSDTNHPLHHLKDNTALFTCDSAAPAFPIAHKFVPPSMSPRALRRYTKNMVRSVEECFNVFDELDKQEQAFNVYHYMFKLAGQIIYRLILGIDVGHFRSIDQPPHPIIKTYGEYLVLMKQVQMSPKWYKYLPFGVFPRLTSVRAKLWGMIDDVIAECEVGGDGRDMPMNECAVNSTCIADYLKRATDDNGDKMPHDLLLSNATALIGAGFATTSSLLSWLIYSLCHYPGDFQDRVLQDLIDHGATEDREWTYDEVTSIPFLDAFVKETHRMHNPSFQTARNSLKDVILPGGWLVPANSVMIPTIPSIHKNKDHWENPHRFDPDRWLSGSNANAEERHRLAFMPFATGPRGCVGYNVAHLEARVAMAKLVYRYRFVDVSTEPMEYDPDFLVVRPLNIYIRAIRRTSWPEKSPQGVA